MIMRRYAFQEQQDCIDFTTAILLLAGSTYQGVTPLSIHSMYKDASTNWCIYAAVNPGFMEVVDNMYRTKSWK